MFELQLSDTVRAVDEVENNSGRRIAYNGNGANVELDTDKQVKQVKLLNGDSTTIDLGNAIDLTDSLTLTVAVTAQDDQLSSGIRLGLSTYSGVFSSGGNGTFSYVADATYNGSDQYNSSGDLIASSGSPANSGTSTAVPVAVVGTEDGKSGGDLTLVLDLSSFSEDPTRKEVLEELLSHVYIAVRDETDMSAASDDWSGENGQWQVTYALTDSNNNTTTEIRTVELIAEDHQLYTETLDSDDELRLFDERGDGIPDRFEIEENWVDASGDPQSYTDHFVITGWTPTDAGYSWSAAWQETFELGFDEGEVLPSSILIDNQPEAITWDSNAAAGGVMGTFSFTEEDEEGGSSIQILVEMVDSDSSGVFDLGDQVIATEGSGGGAMSDTLKAVALGSTITLQAVASDFDDMLLSGTATQHATNGVTGFMLNAANSTPGGAGSDYFQRITLSNDETVTLYDDDNDTVLDRAVYEESWILPGGDTESYTEEYRLTWVGDTWTANAIEHVQLSNWDTDGRPLTVVDDHGADVSITWQPRDASNGKIATVVYNDSWTETDASNNQVTLTSETTVELFDNQNLDGTSSPDGDGHPDTFALTEVEGSQTYTATGEITDIEFDTTNSDKPLSMMAMITTSDDEEDIFSGTVQRDNSGNITDFDFPDLDDDSGSANEPSAYYVMGNGSQGEGYYYPLFLSESEANAVSNATGSHTHTFTEYPGVTFYMPTGVSFEHGGVSMPDAASGLVAYSATGSGGAGTNTGVSVHIKSWKGMTDLEGVSFGGGKMSGTDGRADFTPETGATTLSLQPGWTLDNAEQADADAAVDLQDAISILKMVVGLPINDSGQVSPFQSLAADFDTDGEVGLSDAIGVLKHVVGLSTTGHAHWDFVRSDHTVTDHLSPGTIGGMMSHNIPADTAIPIELVGVLRGDVDGSWESTSMT
jgi:hypothetical protein